MTSWTRNIYIYLSIPLVSSGEGAGTNRFVTKMAIGTLEVVSVVLKPCLNEETRIICQFKLKENEKEKKAEKENVSLYSWTLEG